MARYYEEFTTRESWSSPPRTLTAADVEQFANLTGDRNPIHLDEEAARAGPFGRRVAHGVLVLSVSIGLMQSPDARPPYILAFLGIDRLRFVHPVFLNDTIHVRQKVRSLSPVSPESGWLETDVEVLNDQQVVTVSYVATFLIRRRPKAG